MFKTLLARARQGYRTVAYAGQDAGLPALFRGRPVLDPDKCVTGCTECVDVCPTDALRVTESGLELDIGRCIFCGYCIAACPEGAIAFSRDWRLAASKREGLVATADRPLQIDALSGELRRLLGRSLRLRQVSAGGCNGCEVEVNALGNVVFDSSRFGIDFVASPRHADGVLVTGPVTANMKEALLITYQAIAEPKLVIAAGACAISGGLYRDHQEVSNGVEGLLPVDLYVPGCPPHPFTILDGIMRLLGRL
ncbi:MAG TPA: NADH-quinone oxidoreductase subunit NuoB [Alphaproteobacteria bacterium]|nr:NADH-quinone oxidoreductase subunit NuoB [Alphaproteobacteria bacterium]